MSISNEELVDHLADACQANRVLSESVEEANAECARLQQRVEELERQNERVRQALGDHERDRATLNRIENKLHQVSGSNPMNYQAREQRLRSALREIQVARYLATCHDVARAALSSVPPTGRESE